MQSRRWIFTSPGGENEYKRGSVTREHYDLVIEAKEQEKSTEISVNGKYVDVIFLSFLRISLLCIALQLVLRLIFT